MAAEECCDRINVSGGQEDEDEEDFCPPTWDGWQCWHESGIVNMTMTQPCPEYIYFLTHGGHKGVGCDSKYQTW